MAHSAREDYTVPSTPPIAFQAPSLRISTLPPSIPHLATPSPPRLQRPARPSISRANRPSPLATPGAHYGPRELPKVRRVPSDPPNAREVASRSTALRDRRRIDLTRVIPRSPGSPPKTARTALRQLDIPLVSSFSTSTSTSRGHAMGPGARIDKGKSNPLRRGWARLPDNILTKIFDHVIQDVMLHPDIGALWGENESRATGLTVRQRNTLSLLRLVCRGWKENVDIHAFWLTLPLILDPHEQFTNKQDNTLTSGSRSSTPFQVAREVTLPVCLPCRIVAPHLPSSRSTWENRFHSPAFGIVRACDQHDEDVCCNCLNAGLSRTSGPVNGDIMLYQSQLLDTNSAHQPYPLYSLVCAYCRRDTVAMFIHRGLDEAARSGKRAGSAHEATAMSHPAVQHHVLHARGTARDAAERYLIERWIEDMTRVEELRPAAEHLQRLVADLWRRYLRSGGKDREKEADRSIRLAVMNELFGEGFANPGSRKETDVKWITDVYLTFGFALTRRQVPMILRPEFPHQTGGLSEEFGTMLIRASLQDLITDRVNFGFWVSPSDEVRGYLSPGKQIHTPFADIADSIHQPDSARRSEDYDNPGTALSECEGIISIGARNCDVGAKDRFLPPDRILRQLDSMYETTMDMLLSYAMRRAVRLCRPVDPAKPTPGEILAALRLHESWAAGPLARLPVKLDSDRQYPSTPISAPPHGLSSTGRTGVDPATWMQTPPNSTSPPHAARLPLIEHPPKPTKQDETDHRLPTPVSPINQMDALPRLSHTKKRNSASLHEDLSSDGEEDAPTKRSRFSNPSDAVACDGRDEEMKEKDDIFRGPVEADNQKRDYPRPWIPGPGVDLGHATTSLLQRMWREARDEFLPDVISEYSDYESEEEECDCRICTRYEQEGSEWYDD